MPARKTPSPEALKRAVLDAALKRAATEPFSDRLLADADPEWPAAELRHNPG